jgi:hypothetical protein
MDQRAPLAGLRAYIWTIRQLTAPSRVLPLDMRPRVIVVLLQHHEGVLPYIFDLRTSSQDDH